MDREIIFALILTLIIGCDDNLDTQPTDTLTPEQLLQDPVNLDKTLFGAYAGAEWLEGDLQTVMELLANEGELAYRGTFPGFFEFDRKVITLTNGTARFFWVGTYYSINLCN